jgi:predicted DNA-binding ribbon-helix-helix protein
MSKRRKSLIVKRSILIARRKTGVSLEDAFWKGLKEVAADRNMTPSDMVTTINSKREHDWGVVVRMDLRRLADHSVQRPEPTHVLWPATFFVDAAHRPVAAVHGEVLTILADG